MGDHSTEGIPVVSVHNFCVTDKHNFCVSQITVVESVFRSTIRSSSLPLHDFLQRVLV